jgi:hypothetical protein
MLTVDISIDYNYPNTTYPVVSKKILNDGVLVTQSLALYQEAAIAVDLDEFYSAFKAHIKSELDAKSTIEEESLDKTRNMSYSQLSMAMDYFQRFMYSQWIENAI